MTDSVIAATILSLPEGPYRDVRLLLTQDSRRSGRRLPRAVDLIITLRLATSSKGTVYESGRLPRLWLILTNA